MNQWYIDDYKNSTYHLPSFYFTLVSIFQNVMTSTPEVSLLITTLLMLLIIFFVAQFPVFQRRSISVGLSLLVITSLAAAIFISTHISPPSRPGDSVVPIFILVFAINTMMPLPWWVAVIISILLAVVHLLLAALLSNDFTDSLVEQVRGITIKCFLIKVCWIYLCNSILDWLGYFIDE